MDINDEIANPEDNRNKLILIGNGFDLAHGLKTSYADFLLWYLQNIINGLNTSIPIKPSLKCIYDDEIIKVVKTFDSFQTSLNVDSIKEFWDLKLNNQIHIKFKNQIINKSFLEHLIEVCGEKRWVDIEYEYFSWLSDRYNKHSLDKAYQNGVKKLNDEFTFIQRELGDYIKNEIINKVITIQPHIDGIIQKIDQSTKEKSLYFLNFNYTKTIQKYIYEREFMWVVHDRMEHKNEFKVINIHGEADDDERNAIIFGYGDEMTDYYRKLEEENDNELTKNFKTFHYFKTSNYQELSRFINSDPYDVYILGHSCGISDRVLLNSIFENRKCNSIQIYHYQRKDGTTDYFEKTQEISRCVSGAYKNKLRTKVIPFNENDWMSKEK